LYCNRVIAQRRIKACERLQFDVQPHTIKAVEEANAHFKTIWDAEQDKFIRPLDAREIQWIRNERAMSLCSFPYWASHYAVIRNWQGRLQLFTPNVAQKIAMDIWASTEDDGFAIMMQQLKARQLGFSTICELAVAHRAQFHPNVNAVVASADPDKSDKMSEMIDLVYDQQPAWMVRGLRRVGKEIEFPAIKSAISIQHGSQFNGIARGTTPNVGHLSELADFVDPEELIDASLLRAIHETPETFLMLESTAAGRHDWWHRKWLYNIANWSTGRSRLRPNFLPWFVGTDIWPPDTWVHAHPIPLDWRPFDSTIAHAERAAEYVRDTPLLTKYLGSGWVMPRRQMWFYEIERAEAVANKSLNKFLGEMPASAFEAFQSTNISAFDHDTVELYRAHARHPIGIYGIVGNQGEIPLRIQASQRDIDSNKPRIPITAAWSQNQRPAYYELVPLHMHEYGSQMDFSNKLLIWEKPEEGSIYGVGVDTGDGVGLDRSVVEVLRAGTLERNERQCAEWASAYVNSYDLWPICMAMGTYFSVKHPDGRLIQPKMVIETNRNGEIVQKELLKRGWTKFHVWVRYDRKKTNEGQSQILGWRTVSWSRTMVMDTLLKYIKDGWIDIESPWFIDEMSDLERDENRQSLKAAYGGHDDRIMAVGIVLLSLTIPKVGGRQMQTAITRANQRSEGVVYAKYDPGYQGRDFDRNIVELPVHQYLREYGDI
jgi:hypothetical protein